MSIYAFTSPVVPALLAATSPEPPRWTAHYQHHPDGCTIGRTELLTFPEGKRGRDGSDGVVPWPDDVPTPAALVGEASPAFPKLNQVDITLLGEPEGDDDLILVALAPDGTPHVCAPPDQPAGSLYLGRVTSTGWTARPYARRRRLFRDTTDGPQLWEMDDPEPAA